jgi:hypothetical protein
MSDTSCTVLLPRLNGITSSRKKPATELFSFTVLKIENSGFCAGKRPCNDSLWFRSREFTTLKGVLNKFLSISVRLSRKNLDHLDWS